MRFSPRLKAILSLVEGKVLADIGTDHGFLPIAACLENRVRRAVACDRMPGPLARAEANIRQYGLEDRIETRLGYGLEPLKPDEADCVVIAGMGGMNIVQILQEPITIKRLVLQPQRDIPLVRAALDEMGFKIFNELTTEDRGHTYTVLGAIYG